MSAAGRTGSPPPAAVGAACTAGPPALVGAGGHRGGNGDPRGGGGNPRIGGGPNEAAPEQAPPHHHLPPPLPPPPPGQGSSIPWARLWLLRPARTLLAPPTCPRVARPQEAAGSKCTYAAAGGWAVAGPAWSGSEAPTAAAANACRCRGGSRLSAPAAAGR